SDAMAAAADRDLSGLLAAKIHRVHHVGDGLAPGDERGALVDKAVVHPAGFLVPRVGGVDQLTGERCPYLVGNFDRAMHVWSPFTAVRAEIPRWLPGLPPTCRFGVTAMSQARRPV